MSTPADQRREWYQNMHELFELAATDIFVQRFNRDELKELAAHFGRLAMGEDDEAHKEQHERINHVEPCS